MPGFDPLDTNNKLEEAVERFAHRWPRLFHVGSDEREALREMLRETRREAWDRALAMVGVATALEAAYGSAGISRSGGFFDTLKWIEEKVCKPSEEAVTSWLEAPSSSELIAAARLAPEGKTK